MLILIFSLNSARSPSESIFSYVGDKDFYTYAKCGNAYDPSMEEILDNIPPELEFCNGDIGCLIDGEFAGPEAGEDYLKEPALKRTYEPTPAPSPPPTSGPTGGPTGGPTSAPSAAPVSNFDRSENYLFDDVSEAANEAPVIGDTFNSIDPAGSNGDPHCKFLNHICILRIGASFSSHKQFYFFSLLRSQDMAQ